MNSVRIRVSDIISLMLLSVVGTLCGPESAKGELRWQPPKKEEMRVRLVALAWSHPRSSFFSSEEVFIAEKQLTHNESRLVKVVYEFLPYQPRLSENGLDYSTVHEFRALRDPACDETLSQMNSGEVGDWRQAQPHLRYSTDAPTLNLQRHRSPLPCYVTTAEDYARPVYEPVSEGSY
jgi:hypothetical protein